MMRMHTDSTNAKHKLTIAAVLLTLFALPFALQWQVVSAFDSKALLAGGAVVGNSAFTKVGTSPSTNHAAQISTVSGSSFTGVLVR